MNKHKCCEIDRYILKSIFGKLQLWAVEKITVNYYVNKEYFRNLRKFKWRTFYLWSMYKVWWQVWRYQRGN